MENTIHSFKYEELQAIINNLNDDLKENLFNSDARDSAISSIKNRFNGPIVAVRRYNNLNNNDNISNNTDYDLMSLCYQIEISIAYKDEVFDNALSFTSQNIHILS